VDFGCSGVVAELIHTLVMNTGVSLNERHSLVNAFTLELG